MAVDILLASELGPDFSVGTVTPNKIRLKIGQGLANQPDGTVVAVLPTVTPTLVPIYEYRELTGEESVALTANSWEFGSGDSAATAFHGHFVGGTGWELFEVSLHAGTYPAGATCNIQVAYINNAGTAFTVLNSLTMSGPTDGGGVVNHAFKMNDLTASPVSIPANVVVGFRTLTVVGAISDVRISARIRRQIGQYVSAVALSY